MCETNWNEEIMEFCNHKAETEKLAKGYECEVCGRETPTTIEIDHSPAMCDECYEKWTKVEEETRKVQGQRISARCGLRGSQWIRKQ
jgi:ribosome-binding protein aMBF1 (putative translation factor)